MVGVVVAANEVAGKMNPSKKRARRPKTFFGIRLRISEDVFFGSLSANCIKKSTLTRKVLRINALTLFSNILSG